MARSRQKIHEGIYLINERESQSVIKLSVENKMLKTATVTLNLAGSSDVSVVGSSEMKVSVDIDPTSIGLLACLELGESPKLQTKFKVHMKKLSKEEYDRLIASDVDKLNRRIAVAQNVFRKVDYNNFDLRQIPQEIGHFVDPSFSPTEKSVYLGMEGHTLEFPIHWRRPERFFREEFNVFMDRIEPNDIKQGLLGDCWFMCSLASLAERPKLVRRLFPIDQVNAEGFYQVFFCKGGEWVRVTVDDYFPCFPKEAPIFSRSHGNELWVLLIEKAYAKLHGGYYLLKGGWAAEGMMDLTGCPTVSIEFTTVQGKKMIEDDELWPKLVAFDEKGALISASTVGEDRWTEAGGPDKKFGLVPGHAYTVIQAVEAKGNRLLNIRNPWGRFEWDGKWSDDSELWTEEIRSILNPRLEENDGTFWMSYEDFITHYSGVNICRVDSYYEARLRGRFERRKYGNQEWVLPKGYYIIESEEDTTVSIGIHQDDERMYGVEARRGYIDIGVVVLDNNEGAYRIYRAKEGEKDRQSEIEVPILAHKKYVIWPRTTGCALSRPPGATSESFPWFEGGELHPLFESTIKDLFRKANVLVGEDLTYPEFNSLMKIANVSIDEAQFNQLLADLPSYEQGLTSEGLVEFFRDMCARYDLDTIKGWMRAWGYDEDLYSIKSRNYVLTLHADHELKVQYHKVKDLSMNEMVNIMLLQTQSEQKMSISGVNLHCLLEKSANTFTYGAYNTNPYPVTITFECGDSEGLIFSSLASTMEIEMEAESWKCLVHAQLAKGAQKCRLKPVLKVRR